MNAVRLLAYGGQLVFNDVPTPTIARDEVLVKVTSTAVNCVSREGFRNGTTGTPDRSAVDTRS